MRNSQYAEAMVTNYFTYAHMNAPLTNSQGDGLMAYISRKDCAKALAYALHRSNEFHQKVWNINGLELMTISTFCAIGDVSTGNHVPFVNVTDEENYQIWDAMGVPRTTDGVFQKDSEAPFHQMEWLHLLKQSEKVKWIVIQKTLQYLQEIHLFQ